MNREVMGRQMFRNGGVVYMAEGGNPEVVKIFSDIVSTGDADKIMEYFISHERDLKRAAASNEELRTIIQFIENMEARKADETIAETLRLYEMPSTNKIEVAAPGGSAFIEDTRPFGGETPQPPMSPKTYFDEYRGSEQRPLTDESDEVTKDMLKRRRRIFQSDYSPLPRPLDETEINNAYSMMLSDKGFTDEEIRELATNPSGRMLDYTRRQAEYDFSKDPIGIQDFAEGGMAMPAPMPAAPGPEGIASLPNKAAMESMPMEGVANEASRVGLDPAVVQQMLGEVDSTLGNLENAESYEDVINGIREADAPIEVRYKELASFVGEEDAMQTPESVLTMLQPVIMMAGVDQGIGALASEEMTAPVTGDMAGGIMSTVNMGQEGVPPVNFNLGGAVQYFDPANENRVAGAMPGGRLGELYGEKRDVYRTIMGGGAQEEEYQKQKDLTEAQMLFDIAQGALAFAGGAGKPGRSPAEQLAAAASPVLANIGARAGELSKFKQAQAKEARAMDLAALTAAEGALTAEKAAEGKEVGKPVKIEIFSENENGERNLINSYVQPLTMGELKRLTETYGSGNVKVSAEPVTKDRTVKPAVLVDSDGNTILNFDANNPSQYAKAQSIANNPKYPGVRIYEMGKLPGGPKEASGVTADTLRVFEDTNLIKRFGLGQTDPKETARINTRITDYLQTKTEKYFDPNQKRDVTRIIQNKLPPEVEAALMSREKRGLVIPQFTRSTTKPVSSTVGGEKPITSAEPPVSSTIGGEQPTTSTAVTVNPVVAQILDDVGMDDINKPVNLLESVEDVKAGFGGEAAAKEVANYLVGIFGGTPYPITQEANAAMKTLNDNYIKFFSANNDLRESVFSQKRIEDTIPKPASFGTSLDKAIAQTEATIRASNLALQKIAYSLANLPADEKSYTEQVGKAKQLVGLRDSYRSLVNAYYSSKTPSGGVGLGSNILQQRINERRQKAQKKQGE